MTAGVSRRGRRAADRAPQIAPVLTAFDELDSTRFRPRSAGLTVLMAAILAICGVAGSGHATAEVIAVLGVLLAWQLPRAVRTPAPTGSFVVTAAAALLMPALAGFGDGSAPLRWIPVVVAAATVAGFVVQLARPPARRRLTEGVAATVGGVAVLTSAVMYVPVADSHSSLLVVASVGIAAGGVADLVAGWIRPPMAQLAALLVLAIGLGLWTANLVGMPLLLAVGVSLMCATVSQSARRVLATLPASARPGGATCEATASVLMCGALVGLFALLLV